MESSLNLTWLILVFMKIQRLSLAVQPMMHGEVQSPYYPEHPPSALHKHWDIMVPQGYQLQLNFNYLNISPSKDCRNDSLMILHNGEVMLKYCGEENSENGNHPGNSAIFIPASKVQLTLLTNKSKKGPYPPVGFSAFYQATDVDECSSPGSIPPCSQICLNTMGSYLCACHHGFRLELDQRTCVRVQCESANSINGKITPVLSTYYYKDQITVYCDEGYRITTKGAEVNKFTFTCQSNGQWSLPLPQCHIIHCGEPPQLLNGKVLFISGAHNQYGSVIMLQCNKPYALSSTKNVTYICDADKKWKDDYKIMSVFPKCLPECGHPSNSLTRRKRVLGGQLAPQRAFPWHVFMHSPVRGGGAVIGEQWILTAANNLMSNNRPVSPDKVKIHIGGSDALQMSSMTPLQIESLHIHPSYSNPDFRNFDHDIALIKLKNSVQYNADVMPLCLPSQEDKYLPSLTGWVSGFGQTARSRVSRYLRYTSLPLVEKQRCQQFIDNFKIPVPFTENMFCAGVPKGGKDTCSGDAGGVFVLRKDGAFWAAGIVSWGYECGKPGRYGVYTRVAKYVDWINKTMREN